MLIPRTICDEELSECESKHFSDPSIKTVPGAYLCEDLFPEHPEWVFPQRMVQVSEIKDGPEPTIFLANKGVADVKA